MALLNVLGDMAYFGCKTFFQFGLDQAIKSSNFGPSNLVEYFFYQPTKLDSPDLVEYALKKCVSPRLQIYQNHLLIGHSK